MRLRVALMAALLGVAGSAMAKDSMDSMKIIMADHVNPGALAFWAAGNDPPEGETPAMAKERWAAALKGAQAMEAKGKLMMGGPYTRSGRWNRDAQMMIDVSLEGEKAIKAHDAEKAFEIGGRLYDACKGCHETYVPRRE
jgi:hypothetical protein